MSHFLNYSPDFLGKESTLLNHGGGVAVLITALIVGSFAAFQRRKKEPGSRGETLQRERWLMGWDCWHDGVK